MALSRNGKEQGRKRQNLTLFGEWFDTIRAKLGVSMALVAERSGIPESTLSKATRDNRGISLESVDKLWQALEALAKERDAQETAMSGEYTNTYSRWLSPLKQVRLYNAARHATEEQVELSRIDLRNVQLEMIMARDKLIDELYAEIDRLRSRP